MNKPGGYWVGTVLDDTWVDEIICKKIPKEQISSILMCSDGFDRAFSLYKCAQPEEVLQKKIALRSCLDTLRNIEESDSCCIRYPRLKKSDDCVAIRMDMNI